LRSFDPIEIFQCRTISDVDEPLLKKLPSLEYVKATIYNNSDEFIEAVEIEIFRLLKVNNLVLVYTFAYLLYHT